MNNETPPGGEDTTGQVKILGEGIYQLHETIKDLQAQLAAERDRTSHLTSDKDAIEVYRRLMINQAQSLGAVRLIEQLGVNDQTKTHPDTVVGVMAVFKLVEIAVKKAVTNDSSISPEDRARETNHRLRQLFALLPDRTAEAAFSHILSFVCEADL